MQQLSLEAKESIVLKAINRGTTSMKSIAESNNVSLSTLYQWLKQSREGQPLKDKGKSSSTNNELTRSEKFNHILTTSQLDEVSLGAYCREHGIYSHQLTQWRESFMSNPVTAINPKIQSELKTLREDKKRLERDLRRKEKALAEASALLVMKKKADLIWGANEDD